MDTKATQLRLHDLPVFSNAEELASVFNIDAKRIKILSGQNRRFYRRYEVPKRSGGNRTITQPNREMKSVQACVLRLILDKLQPSPYATAFIRKSDLLNNCRPHTQNRYFLCLDLEDFFPSIGFRRVSNVFKSIGYSSDASRMLAELCTCNGSLPQGAVTSPSLSNLISSKLDRRLAGLCAKLGITYTRYADDLTFSCNNPKLRRKILPTVKSIISEEGFIINYNKTKLMGPDSQCEVTGLVKNSTKPEFSIGRRRLRIIRAEMYAIAKGGSGLKYRDKLAIEGVLGFVKSVSQCQYEYLSSYWNRLLENEQGELPVTIQEPAD